MEDKAVERTQRVAKIFKLVDGCKRCGLAFRIATENSSNSALQRFSDQLRQMLDRFCFELLAEIRRIDSEKLVDSSVYNGKIANKDVLGGHGDAALAGLIGDYEDVLLDHIPAHAGAMIKRQ